MLTEKEVLAGSMIYIMLKSIDPDEPAGKRARKGISRVIKKEIAIFASETKDKKRYSELVDTAFKLIFSAKDKTDKNELIAEPGVIISTLMNRWPDLVVGFDIKQEHVDSLREAYSDSKLQFMSTKYANRVAEVVNDFIGKEKQDGQND